MLSHQLGGDTRELLVPLFFLLGENIQQKKKKQKNKDHRCLQAEARQSGPWIRGVQCAELQMMQRYTVFDVTLTMHHTGLTGRQRNRRKVRINTHTHMLMLPQFKMVWVQQPYKSTTPPPPPPRAPQPCLDVYVEKTLFFLVVKMKTYTHLGNGRFPAKPSGEPVSTVGLFSSRFEAVWPAGATVRR